MSTTSSQTLHKINTNTNTHTHTHTHTRALCLSSLTLKDPKTKSTANFNHQVVVLKCGK